MLIHSVTHLVLAGDNTPTSDKVALYAMISALGVALIYGIFNFLTSRVGKPPSATTARKVTKEHQAFERFLIAQGFDPRKIKTGYESIEEVRRAQAPT
jgi:hypothetical protein